MLSRFNEFVLADETGERLKITARPGYVWKFGIRSDGMDSSK